MWWMMRRAPVHYAVADAVSSGSLWGGCRGEHQYTMRWMARRAVVHYLVNDGASNGTLCGG